MISLQQDYFFRKKITLIDDDEPITDERKVANALNDFLSSI